MKIAILTLMLLIAILRPVGLKNLQELVVMFEKPSGGGVLIKQGVISVSHLIGDDTQIWLVNGEKKLAGKVLKIDRGLDLALIEIEEGHEYARLRFNPHLGEQIYIVGAPVGFEDTVTFGRIAKVTKDYLIVDARISMGSSGGGVFDRRGNLLGIIQGIQGYFGYWPGEHMNIAIPAEKIKQFLRD